jgi:hypothetical protein
MKWSDFLTPRIQKRGINDDTDNNDQPPRYHTVVLAADNYRVTATYNGDGASQSKTLAAACASGRCEATPFSSVLTVNIAGATADTVQLSIAGRPQWGPFSGLSGEQKLCVWNLVDTEVTATFNGVSARADNINCETLDQTCEASMTTEMCPDFGCLASDMPGGPAAVQYVVFSQSQGVFHQASGAPSEVLQCTWVPAVDDLAVEVIEGNNCPTTAECLACAAQQTAVQCGSQLAGCFQDAQCAACATANNVFAPACHVQDNAALNALKACQQGACPACASAQNPFSGGCVRYALPVSPCSGSPATCTTQGGSFGRMLSLFELFALPYRQVTVTLVTPDNAPFREMTDQGGAPGMYCVLPAVIRAQLREGESTWGSSNTNCLVDKPGEFDCTICNFLTMVKFDLRGIPRGASAVFAASEVGAALGQKQPYRFTSWVGGIPNKIVGLRSGAGTLPPQQTWVTVSDSGATKTLTQVCDGQVCVFEPFTTQLCADLSDPAGVEAGKGVCDEEGEGRLTAHLYTASGHKFRSVPYQGCCNGCGRGAVNLTKKRKNNKRTPNPWMCGSYTVLRIDLQYSLQENSAETALVAVDCTGDSCAAPRLVHELTVDTRCGTGLAGAPYVAQSNLDVTLLDATGTQVRGPTTAYQQDCSIGPEYFNGPTCQDVGNMEARLGVIGTEYQVRVEQLRVDTTRSQYPDRTEHPTVTVPVSCGAGDCSVADGQIFSTYLVRSERGLPNSNPGPATAAVKFGETQQNVFAVYNAQSQPATLLGTGTNSWCVLADQRPWYAVNWEAWASDGPGRDYSDCASRSENKDVCTTNGQTIVVVPADKKK